MKLQRAWIMVILVLLLASPSAADEGGDSIVSEVRGGIYAHDIDLWSFHRESGMDANGEILFISPTLLEDVWAPRPHLGATVNLSGKTSHVYSGLTWEFALSADFFVDANLGLSLHNGRLDTDEGDRKSFGSRVLFRLGGALGYNLTEKWNISLQYEHMSNAYLADPNEGMDNVGVRLGYRF